MFARTPNESRRLVDLDLSPDTFASLADTSPDPLAIATDGTLVFANAAARLFLTGSKDGKTDGRPLLSLVHPDDREDGLRLMEQVRVTGEPLSWTSVRILSDHAAERPMRVRLLPLEFRGLPSLLIVGRDERAQERAQRERDESVRRYQTLADSAPVAIERLDADGRCVYVNQSYTALVGHRPEEVLGRLWTDLVIERDRPAARQLWRRMCDEGIPVRGEYHIVREDGREIDVIAQAVPERDESGVVTGWLASFTDLTDLKRAQRALADSEERLRIALEAAAVASWETDNAASDEVRWSPNAAHVLGVPEQDVPRTRATFWARVPPESVDDLRRQARAAIGAGDVLDLEIRAPSDSQPERWLSVRGRAYTAPGGSSTRMAGIVSDVTARRRLADEREALVAKLQEAERLESLGLLAAGIAHDFNNLLVGILGNAELALASAPPDAALRGRLEELRGASLRAAELAQQILAYSGRGPLLAAPVDLGVLAAETIALVRASLPRHARLRVDAQPGAVVEGDATQLRQVLMNLVRNAAEALDPSGGDVTVVVVRDAGEATVQLTVTDTGCGIDAATRARIFDPFFTTRPTGRGLGLAVVQGIVRAHGGAISVESEPGRGTRIVVRVPSSRGDGAEAPAPTTRKVTAAAGGRVLVADDERAVREVARLALEAAGYEVICAADADEASALARERGARLDAVLLDLSIGRGASEGVIAQIRAAAPLLPILVTSGFAEDEALVRLAAHGIAGFLQKPFTPAQLAARIGEAIAKAG
jgi:two-component system cell cycle sensor histidine kinase/response regulator CckA